MIKKNWLLLILFLFLSTPFSFSEEFSCDKDESSKWNILIQRNPNDLDIQALYTLREGLCLRVNRGDITVGQAKDIFYNAWNAILANKPRGYK